MEYLDIIDENNNLINKIEDKDKVHEYGVWHREIVVWIYNNNKQILIQKRASSKKINPNCWGLCAGHVSAGEDVRYAMLREIKEEIGIDINKEELEFLFMEKVDNTIDRKFAYHYLLKSNRDINKYTIQLEELSEVKYINYDLLNAIVQDKNELYTFSQNENIEFVIKKLRDKWGCNNENRNRY